MNINTLKNTFFFNKLFIFLIVLLVIYSSGYALSTVYQFNLYIEILFAYIFLFPIFIVYFNRKINIFFLSFSLLIIMLITTFIFSGMTALTSYLLIISKIIIAFGITTIYDFKKFVEIYQKVMISVSIISLFGYFYVSNGDLSLNLPVVENLNSVSYVVGYIFFYIPWIPERNMGIFWEPGLYASFLVIGIIFELIYRKSKPNWLIILLYTLTIFTTNSSAGFGLLLFLVCLLIVKFSNSIKAIYIRYIINLASISLVLILLFNYSSIFKLIGVADVPIISKIIGEELSNQSRILALTHNFSYFLEKPIFGWGLTESFKLSKYVADTSTSTFLMNAFGFLGIQYSIYWVYGILKSKLNEGMLVKVLVSIIFLLILNKEPHFNILISWCIMFFFLKSTKVHK